jgi:ACS family sodium-dependent inorganic phosphate cotransporter
VRVSPGGGGGGAGGFASAVEKRSIPGIVGEEEHGARGEEELEGEVAGALELRWPPWKGLAERYKLIGATSLAFVICNMDKVTHPVCVSRGRFRSLAVGAG